MSRFAAIVLAIIMIFTIMAEPVSAIGAIIGASPVMPSATGDQYTPDHANKPMHFLVRHWHAVDSAGNKLPADESVSVEGYIEKLSDGYKITFIDEYGRETAAPDGVTAADDSIKISAVQNENESFAGFSVSAGHDAASITNTTLTVKYNENIHLVKGHVFYVSQKATVQGFDPQDTITGASGLDGNPEQDTVIVYAYPNGTKNIDDNADISGTAVGVVGGDGKTEYYALSGEGLESTVKAHIESLLSEGKITINGIDTVDWSTVELGAVKLYYTADGLHTDKTASARDDGRTFDIDLEAWFIGNNIADVGLILDASGSMAFPSEDLYTKYGPMYVGDIVDSSKWITAPTSQNQTFPEDKFLDATTLAKILDTAKTDNSPLGYADYSYFVFDPRTATNEYVPIGYWDGDTSSVVLNAQNSNEYYFKDSNGTAIATIRKELATNEADVSGWYFISSSDTWSTYITPYGISKYYRSIYFNSNASQCVYYYSGNTYTTDGVKAETGVPDSNNYFKYEKYQSGSANANKNYEPLQFFVDKDGYLCCFFNSGGTGAERSGWSYVYEKPDSSRLKVETLQHALGLFVVRLDEASHDSKLSAVRFSASDSESDNRLGDNYDKLVMLNWTNDPSEAISIFNLNRNGGGFLDNVDGQYNYGMTGGTNTITGFKAFVDYLGGKADSNVENKYLIVFTDGKDSTYSGGEDNAAFTYADDYLSDYEIITVMLACGTVEEGTADYTQALEFLARLAGESYDKDTKPTNYELKDGETEDDITRYENVYVAYKSEDLEKLFSEDIVYRIADQLNDYAIQDYIDPRFDLVDADGVVWKLEKNGMVTKGDAKNAAKISEDGEPITLTNSADVESERRTAKLYYDAEEDMYFLRWTEQAIPGSSAGVSRLPIWNTTITVRAKDDFIGGNAVLTNGNKENQNYVYYSDPNNEGVDKSSGTDKAEQTSDKYPSKGFPRTTVNVELPTLEMTDGDQLIFMGEDLTPEEVAEKLGKKITDYLKNNKTASNQWYWNYLDRYAAYSGEYEDFDALLGAIIDAEESESGSISFPYSYIPGDGTTQTGGSDHEEDVLGYIVFSWETKAEGEGEDYPDDGVTVDTKRRVSKLTVRYVPLLADDEPINDVPDIDLENETRKEYNDVLVKEEDDSGELIYGWDSSYKPAAGEPTIGDERIDPNDPDSDERLTGTGTYTTDIVKGEIVLEMRIPADAVDYITEHSFDGADTQIKYTADINRTYNGKTTTVGTLTIDTKLSDLGDPVTADDGSVYYRVYATLELNDEVTVDEDPTEDANLPAGLPIGTYTLSKNSEDGSSAVPTGLSFTSIKVLDIGRESNNEDISEQYKTYTTYHPDTDNDYYNEYYKEDFDKYYADYNKNANQIYIGIVFNNNSTYTNMRYGLAMIEVELDTAPISVRKTVDHPHNEDVIGEEFEFTVSLFDENGKELKGEFLYDKLDSSNGKISEDAKIENGGTVTLKDGETFTIKDLPVGAKVIVTEKSTGNTYIYDTTYTVDKSASTAYTDSGVDVTVGDDELVVFKNAIQTGSLEIAKEVSGVKPSSEDAREFEFIVTLTVVEGDDEKPLIGDYTYTVKTAKGDVIRTLDKTANAGEYKLNIADGETAIINGLPVGAKYTVKEADYNEYDASYSVNDSDVANGEIPSGEIEKNDSDSIDVSNAYKSGELTITKTVTGAGGNEDDEFTFTVKLYLENENGDAVALNGRYSCSFEDGSTGYLNLIQQDDGSYVGTITLKHGQSVTIENLPEGTVFTVTEEEADKNGYTTTCETTYTDSEGNTTEPDSVNTGSVASDKTATVAYTNERGVNDLTVKKIVKTVGDTALQDDDENAEFTFTINLTDASGKPASGRFTVSGNAKYTEIEFVDGVAEVTLKHNEEIIIKDIPNGFKYTVVEKPDDNYSTSPNGSKGDIDANGNASAAEFTNTRKAGNISIRKILIADTDVTLDSEDLAYPFEFEVTFTDADGNELKGEFESVYSDENGVLSDAPETVSSGDKVHLLSGQTIKILNLPFGAKVTVREIDDLTDNYAFKSLDIEGTTSVENELFETITAHIVTEENGTLVYTNIKKKVARLDITKTVVDTNGVVVEDDDTEFTFTVTLTPPSGSLLAGSYKYLIKDSDGNIVDDTGVLTLDDVTKSGTITLKHGQTVTIADLPIGTSYKVEEDETLLGDLYELKSSEDTEGQVYDVVLATAKFINTYKPRNTNVNIPVTKELTGNIPETDANGDPASYTFNFNATLVMINGEATVGEARKTFTTSVTLPDNGEKNGSAAIEDVYTAVGTYVYEITEEKGDKHGVTYDDRTYVVTVTVGYVIDEETQKPTDALEVISCTVELKGAAGGLTAVEPNDDGESVVPFENTYVPDPVTAHFEGTKDLVGLTMSDDFRNAFEFTLTAVDGAPMPEEANGEDSYTVTNEYHDIVFGDIEYTEAGTYEYTVTEKGFAESFDDDDIRAQMTNDGTTVYVTVAVEDKDGVLEATVTYRYGDGDEEEDFTFINVYTTPITARIPVIKNIEGDIPAGGRYTFSFEATLIEVDGNEIEESEQVTETATVTLPTVEGAKSTSADFEFTYDKIGTYVYEIRETKGGTTEDGIAYDETVYIVTVNVTDENGDGVLEYEINAVIEGEEAVDVEFTNTYKPDDSDAVTPAVRKILDGGTLIGDDFSFILKLVSENGDYVKGLDDDGTLTAKNDINGVVTFGDIEFTKDGTYIFEVREHIPSPEDDDYNSLITYDTDKIVTVIYTVTDVNGKLEVSDPAYGTSGDTFRNALRPSGDLNITKFVTGTGGETDKSFTFTVTLTAPEGVDLAASYDYDIDNENGVIFTGGNGALTVEFSLKHGESITIKGLPEGTGYEVVENEANEDGYVTNDDEASGTIPAANVASATFVNERSKRSLTVEKIVAGADLSEDEKKKDDFTFTVYLNIPDADTSQTYSYKTDSEAYSELVFSYDAETGMFRSAPFDLKHGESIAVYYLPAGATYTVIEEKDSRYTTVSSGENGTIPASGDASTVFVNTKLSSPVGTLTVYKVVAGDGVVGNERFEFTVSLDIPDADITEIYSYKTDNASVGDLEFRYDPVTAKFTAAIELGHLESISIVGLPSGIAYTVTEYDYSEEGFTTAATGGLESVSSGSNAVEGTIPVSGGASAVFVNTKHIEPTGSLRITKTVAGTAEYNGEKFGFKVSLDVPDNVTLKDSYDTDRENFSVSFTYDEVSGKYVSNEIKLADGESITILDLPDGVGYTVEETDAPDYDDVIKTDDNGLIVANTTANAVFVNVKNKESEPTGSLMVTKTVVGENADPDNHIFHFTVTLYSVYNEFERVVYDWNETIGDVTFNGGAAGVDLKHGESKVLTGLPAGVIYVVEEDDYTWLGYETISDGEIGTIPENGVAIAAFENANPLTSEYTGSLVVTKVVTGNDAETDRDFHFTVTLYSVYNEFNEAENVIYELTGPYGEMMFDGGSYSFTLKHGQSISAVGLPSGITYKVVETEAGTEGYTTAASNAVGLIPADDLVVASFDNARSITATGDLTVVKTVTGTDAGSNAEFTFTISLTDPFTGANISGRYRYSGSKSGVIENGFGTVKLSNGESITISGIPVGTVYKVVETEANTDGYVTTSTGDVGSITEAGATASFINNRDKGTGSLTVIKAVTNGEEEDENKLFNFSVTLYSNYAESKVYDLNDKFGDMTFNNGTANFTLKHGDSITAIDLPVGITYEVAETGNDGYTVTTVGEIGTITQNLPAVAVFVNDKNSDGVVVVPGSLSVTKVVMGDDADADDEFSFRVTVKDENDNPISGEYGDMTFDENGVAAFTLKHGDSRTATGLPDKTTYTVEETDNKGYEVTYTNETGTIAAGETAAAVVVNTKNPAVGNLTVTKTVTGSDGDKTKSFTFTVTLYSDPDKTQIYSLNGIFGDMEFKSGKAAFTLKHGESKTASGLPAGVFYSVAETDNDGYDVTSSNESGTITVNETATAMFTNEKNKSVNPPVTNPETQYGNLAITKTVQGGISYERFMFTVLLLDANGMPITGSYPYAGSVSGTITSGGTVWLGHGDWIIISNIPAGTRYIVTESVPIGFTSTSVNAGNTIVANATQKADFTNRIESATVTPGPDIQVGDLTVTKKVDSGGDTNREFEFVVYLTDANGAALSGEFYYTGYKTGSISNGQKFTLKHGEKIVIHDLPIGTRYIVSELTPTGYFVVANGEVGTIRAGGNIAEFVNYKEIERPTEAGDVDTDEEETVEASEVGDIESNPHTGVRPLGGVMAGLICAAAIALLKRRGEKA